MLENIKSPADLKSLSVKELNILSAEIREKLLEVVPKNGGHLASNLGAVELTVALHSVFNSPNDRIIWDVGHQAYVHKMLTGRNSRIDTIRTYGGLSGFPKREESEHDSFGAGHASTSVSAAVGLATADALAGKTNYTVAVAGDGAFTGGMIYEALNNIAEQKLRLIVVLNDNDMAIDHNIGGINRYISRLSTSTRYLGLKYHIKKFFGAIPLVGRPLTVMCRGIKNFIKRLVWRDNMFENLGLNYYGPVDGYNIKRLQGVFKDAMRDKKSSIIHVRTVKGKGYTPAEQQPEKYHGVPKGGVFKAGGGFSEVFGNIVSKRAEKDARLCAVTAAMCEGTGLGGFKQSFPNRFFDVGIAEEHALTFCAGLSAGGMRPVFAVYSTFAQRCYDQLIHDAALQKLPLVLGLDRAGIVGEDGPTHHGLFDVGFMLQLPGSALYAPESYEDMEKAFSEAFEYDGVAAVRYPRGGEREYDRSIYTDLGGMSYADFGSGKDVAIITYGVLAYNCVEAARLLAKQGLGVRVIRVLKLKPLDKTKLVSLAEGYKTLYLAEEGVKNGGFAEHIAALAAESNAMQGARVVIRAVDECFVAHGNTERLFEECGFTAAQMAAEITGKSYGA